MSGLCSLGEWYMVGNHTSAELCPCPFLHLGEDEDV